LTTGWRTWWWIGGVVGFVCSEGKCVHEVRKEEGKETRVVDTRKQKRECDGLGLVVGKCALI